MLVIERCIYTDLNYTEMLPGTPPLITNKDAVMYSLHNLLTTVKGERLNLVTYGVDLPDHLFEQIDDLTSDSLRFALIEAIKIWEPRVSLNLNESTVIPNYDENAYDLHLVFDIVGINEGSLILTGLYKKQFIKDMSEN